MEVRKIKEKDYATNVDKWVTTSPIVQISREITKEKRLKVEERVKGLQNT
jgi:hypothetical protein